MNPFVRKLNHFLPLSSASVAALEAACSRVRRLPAGTEFAREGDRPQDIHLVLQGMACRHKSLNDGRRQIVGYLVPGDLCDPYSFILTQSDHTITLVSDGALAYLTPQSILHLTAQFPDLARAIWWSTLVDEATLREWLLGVGRRPATQRVAHLLCELLVRLQCVGLATDNSYELPITQRDLADTCGLSNVHINRTIQLLRSEKLISWKGDRLVIGDVERLKEFAEFRSNYLHLQQAAPIDPPVRRGGE